jgi:hypothetical protein
MIRLHTFSRLAQGLLQGSASWSARTALVTAALANLATGCEKPAAEPVASAPSTKPTTSAIALLPSAPPLSSSQMGTLPPSHPPIGTEAPMLAKPNEAATSELAWTAPKRWLSVANPNSMRIATLKIPKAGSDAEDAELSVSQAGGALEDNITRWEKQFEGAPKAKRSEKKVGDLSVTLVEIEGTYSGMGGAAKPGTMMLAAIVATSMPHFFKLTGSKATVQAARKEFDEFVASIKKK